MISLTHLSNWVNVSLVIFSDHLGCEPEDIERNEVFVCAEKRGIVCFDGVGMGREGVTQSLMQIRRSLEQRVPQTF